MGANLALTGVLFFSVFLLMVKLDNGNVPDAYKLIALTSGAVGCLAIFVGALVSIWS